LFTLTRNALRKIR